MCFFVFVNDTATPEIYTLSLHDALPIWSVDQATSWNGPPAGTPAEGRRGDRKSTRLNSSHTIISYAVFCLKKKTFLKPPCSDTMTPSRHSAPAHRGGISACASIAAVSFFFNDTATTE